MFAGIVSSAVGLVILIGLVIILVAAPVVFVVFLVQMLRDR
jgi:hypothetical protein